MYVVQCVQWQEVSFTTSLTFTNDFIRYGYVYLLKHKSDSFKKFKEFKVEVENQRGGSIRTLRSDRGGEYLSIEFKNYLKDYGIVSQLTPPGTPQWNGVSERRNRTLLDMVRSMMSHTNLPMSFWGYALETYDILDFRVSINTCFVFSCYYICVIVSVLVYISFGRIFNVAVTRIISTSRLDDRTFNQENSDKPDSGFLFLNIFKETVNYRIFSKL